MNHSDTEHIRYCLYARKSTESDERQAMSIESQISEMKKIAEQEGLQIVDARTESKSAKSAGVRAVYNKMLEDIENGYFDGILTWAPDRLSRNAGDLGKLVDLIDNGHLRHIRTYGQTFTNNPNEKFLLMILCSQAKLENDNRSKNVMRGMRAMCARGKRPGPPPLGYKILRDPHRVRGNNQIVLDEERSIYIKKLFELVAGGLSGRKTKQRMQELGLTTKRGKPINLSTVYRVLKDTFYYGEFEWPRGSGNLYKTSCETIITKAEYIAANNQLRTYAKSKWGAKIFFFGKIFKCGQCGSGITGEEKIKKSGKRYVYYKCNRYGGKKFCHQKYIREEKLIEELASLIDQLKEKDIRLDNKLTKAVSEMNAVNRLMNKGAKEISVTNYVQCVLSSDDTRKKGQILRCIKGKLTLKNGAVKLEK